MGTNGLPFDADRPISDLSLTEIAGEMEKITSWIETERVEEREARKTYQEVADRVNAKIDKIRTYGQALVREQSRRVSGFDGLLGTTTEIAPPPRGGEIKPMERTHKRNISEAILAVWGLPDYQEPLTTEEIAEALTDVGYESKAAPRSLKSSLNQALAKLCRDGTVDRYRMDGSRIEPTEMRARARKYMLSSLTEAHSE